MFFDVAAKFINGPTGTTCSVTGPCRKGAQADDHSSPDYRRERRRYQAWKIPYGWTSNPRRTLWSASTVVVSAKTRSRR